MTLAPLTVEGRGALATITKSVLQVDDPDNAADVLVMVLEPPRYGRLTRLHGDRALSRFKLEELSREQIQYIHNSSEGMEDGVVLQVNDGHSYRNVLLQVHINQKVGRTEGDDGRLMAQGWCLIFISQLHAPKLAAVEVCIHPLTLHWDWKDSLTLFFHIFTCNGHGAPLIDKVWFCKGQNRFQQQQIHF